MTILKHDPDEGCFGCPLWHDGPDVCAATGTEIEDNYPPAPPDCPLRLGPVGVVPPGWDEVSTPQHPDGGTCRMKHPRGSEAGGCPCHGPLDCPLPH